MEMLDSMRKPFFLIALIAIFLAVLVELGSMAVLGNSSTVHALEAPTPGRAIPALPLLDGLVFYAALLIGIALLIPERVQAKIQGIISVIVSILLLIGSIVLVFVDIALLILMVSLLLAVPFGTIAYFAAFASFDTSGARIALSLIMFLKVVFAVCLVLAHQGFLQNKSLVLIIITSLVANLIVAFLQGFVPGFLVSITDDIAAIVVCILAIIWAVVYLIFGIWSVVKVII
jgi:hypothetical protein